MDHSRARFLLGVGTGADHETIERAFRRAAVAAHPDRGGDSESFRRLVQARDVLCGRPTAPAPHPNSTGWAPRPARPAVHVIRRRTRWWDPVVRFLFGQPAPLGRQLD